MNASHGEETRPSPVLAYVGLGSNLGDREATLKSALEALARLPHTRLLRHSSWFENPAVGIVDGKSFLNGVAELETALSPRALLDQLLEIERAHGRARKRRGRAGVYQSRTLDLDLLLHGDHRIAEEGLVVPHPRMLEREFVLVPLRELGVVPTPLTHIPRQTKPRP